MVVNLLDCVKRCESVCGLMLGVFCDAWPPYFSYLSFILNILFIGYLKTNLAHVVLIFVYQSTRLYIYKHTVQLWLPVWHYPVTVVGPVNHCLNTVMLEAWRQCGGFVGNESGFVSIIVVQGQVLRTELGYHTLIFLCLSRTAHTTLLDTDNIRPILNPLSTLVVVSEQLHHTMITALLHHDDGMTSFLRNSGYMIVPGLGW